MSREIKFRAWDSHYSTWHSIGVPIVVTSSYLIGWHVGDSRFRGNPCINAPSDSDGFVKYSAERYIIERFTGLKDSKGTDIYEGDLVTFQRWDNDTILRGPVWWYTEAAAWAFGRYTGSHCDEPFFWGYTASGIRDGSVKVVGNIHEDNGLT